MSIVLTKTNNTINLQKAGIKLSSGILLALSWSSKGNTPPLDLDASVFCLNASGKIPNEESFVFFNNMKTAGVQLTGDSRDGKAEGIDESILINLSALDPAIASVVVCVTIYDRNNQGFNFSMVDAKIAIIDSTTKTEAATYDLDDKSPTANAVVMGILVKLPTGEWEFQAKGENVNGGLEALLNRYQ
jgi:tellurium resistance protein TerD